MIDEVYSHLGIRLIPMFLNVTRNQMYSFLLLVEDIMTVYAIIQIII